LSGVPRGQQGEIVSAQRAKVSPGGNDNRDESHPSAWAVRHSHKPAAHFFALDGPPGQKKVDAVRGVLLG
jgi:hypothetical protein